MATKCLVPVCKLLLIARFFLVFPGGNCVFGELRTISDCSCVGCTTTYQCTVPGNGITIWQGDEFNCPFQGNKIVLRHENFIGGTFGECNGGKITGRSLSENGSNYSSQLTVYMTYELNDTTIECLYEDLATNAKSKIGQIQLILKTVPFDPPNDVHLADAGPGNLKFSWSPVANHCASLQYNINSTCGVCPSVTNSTSALCTIDDTLSHNANKCAFKTRSGVCDNITGRWSDPIYVILKVPEPPVITGTQASYDTNELTGLIVNYRASTKDIFNITRGISGYVHNFTVEFSDSLTNINVSCAPLTTFSLNSSLPQACFPLQLMNNNIMVSISASNRLGKGKASIDVIAGTNKYVNLSTSSERIICRFVFEQESNNIRSCSASYGECGESKLHWKTVLGNITESLTIVSINLLSNNVMQEYCYEVTATINNRTVIIHGSHSNKGGGDAQVQPMLIKPAIIPVALLFSMAVVIISVIIVFKIYRKYRSYGVHAIFELLDQPWQLLKLLGGLKDLDISINETKFGECTSKGTRNIYMRFDRDISKEQAIRMKQQINELKLLNRKLMGSRPTNSVKSIPIHELESTKTRKMDSVPEINGFNLKSRSYYQYSRCLPPRPGALYSLILGMKALSSANNNVYGDVNFTGIEETPVGSVGEIEICLKFVCEHELPANWRDVFDNNMININE